MTCDVFLELAMTMRSLLSMGLVFSVLSAAPSAFADTLFNFSFTGTDFSGSGVLTTTATGTAGEYLITNVTGTTNGKTISGVEPVNSAGFNNDNLLFYNSPASSTDFDLYGVVYALSTSADVNLFYQDPTYGEYLLRPNGNSFLLDHATISVSPVASAVPEPESLMLLGTGALGLFGVLRRRMAR